MKEHFGLYLILTDPVAGYEACTRAAVECNVRYLQLRMKDAMPPVLLETAEMMRQITNNTLTRLIINDDPAVAKAVDADGLHVGQTDQPLHEVRDLWNAPGKIFGLSTHNEEQVQQALSLKPDYIGIGPVFPTATKPDADPALGILETGRLMQATPLTTVAIGGISAENLPDLLQAGADNFCVVRAVNQAEDPVIAIQQLQEIWKRHNF